MELLDVRYAIRARFEFTPVAGPRDNAGQHANMFRTRARRQQFFRTPYLGRRDLVADVRLMVDEEPTISYHAHSGEADLGWMICDRDFDGDHRLLFYRARMVDGVIDLTVLDRHELAA